MIIYLDGDFRPVREYEATIAKVIPEVGVPYFVAMQGKRQLAAVDDRFIHADMEKE